MSFWWSSLWFLVLCAGHCKLWAEFVNQLHARPWSCGALHRWRLLHDTAIVLFPALLLADLSGLFPFWASTDAVYPAAVLWRCYLGLCGAGLAWLLGTTAAHLSWKVPPQQLSNHTFRHDIAAELGAIPLGHGLHRELALLPFNEQFQLDVTHKMLVHPDLPREWDGLRILHLSDWHWHGTVDLPYFRRVAEIAHSQPADLIVFTGDLVDRMECLAWTEQTLATLSAPLGQFFILGNHDWYQQPGVIRAALTHSGWTDVSSRVVRVPYQGRMLAIGGDETPWMGSVPDFTDVAEADFRLLLSHTPDHFPRAVTQEVHLLLAGHNHGGQIRLPLLGPVFSPSRFGTRFASGTFFDPPTLMHVSRGLSGRHPYRWNCAPEITLLTLHRA